MLPRVGPAERAQATARLKLQLSDPGVEAALAALPAQARRDAGRDVRPAALAPQERQRGRRARDPAQPARRAAPAGAVVARAGQGDPRGAGRAIRSSSPTVSPAPAGRRAASPFAEAEWLAGWLALQFTGQPKAARQHFERLWPAVATPISRGRAGYWSGRAAAAVGAIRRRGHLVRARRRLSQQLLRPARGGRDRPRPDPPACRQRARPRRRRETRCGGARRRSLAAPVLPLRAGPLRPAILPPSGLRGGRRSAGARGRGRARAGLRAGRPRPGRDPRRRRQRHPSGARSPTRCRGSPAFRRDHDGMAEPALVLAVARQESLFDPVARSSAGCHGADAAHARNGPDGVARARRGLYARAAGARPGLQCPPGRLLSGPAARPLRRRAGPGAGRLQCRAPAA